MNEDDHGCFIFCNHHMEIGKRELKQGGKERIRKVEDNEKDEVRMKRVKGEGNVQDNHKR